MAIQSVNDLIISAANVRSHTAFVTAPFIMYSADRPGAAHELYESGFYGAFYSGSSTACVNMTQDNSIFLRNHGGNVSPLKKHLINIANAPDTSTFAYMLLLQDLQCYWKVDIGSNSNGVTQTLSGTPSLRYPNGEGCFLYLANWTSNWTPKSQVEVTYINQSGVSRTSPALNLASNFYYFGQLLGSGRHDGGNRMYLPLQGSDYGVQNVSSIKFSSIDYTGITPLTSMSLVLGLARPIMSFPVCPNGRSAAMVDLTKYVPSLPEIRDGACLSMLGISLDYNPSGTNTNNLAFQFVWG